MTLADSARILRLKIGDRSLQDAGLAGAVKRGLRLAIARAGRSFSDLELSLVSLEEHELPLEAMVTALAKARSVQLMSGPKDRQGIAVMDDAFIASVLEQVTTGSVRSTPPEDRRPTRTDMILCADLLDQILREIAVEMNEIPQAPLISDFSYVRALTDPSGVELTLENDFYRFYRLGLDIAGGVRTAELILCFQSGSAVVGGGGPRKRNWDSDWREQVEHVPVKVQAIMYQTRMPLRRVTDLKPGDLIEIPIGRLEQVVLTGSNRKPVARGKLGRQGLNRAIRILEIGGKSKTAPGNDGNFDTPDIRGSGPAAASGPGETGPAPKAQSIPMAFPAMAAMPPISMGNVEPE